MCVAFCTYEAKYRSFVSFWPVKNLAELVDRPNTVREVARAGFSFVSLTNACSLSLDK